MKAGYVNTVSSACHQVVMLKAEASREKPAYPKIYLLFIEKKKTAIINVLLWLRMKVMNNRTFVQVRSLIL